MAITATHSATSSKKSDSHDSHDERDATRIATSSQTHEATPLPGELGKKSGVGGSQPMLPSAEPARLDGELDDPYDNVACTD
jgi:hypothetical protein